MPDSQCKEANYERASKYFFWHAKNNGSNIYNDSNANALRSVKLYYVFLCALLFCSASFILILSRKDQENEEPSHLPVSRKAFKDKKIIKLATAQSSVKVEEKPKRFNLYWKKRKGTFKNGKRVGGRKLRDSNPCQTQPAKSEIVGAAVL